MSEELRAEDTKKYRREVASALSRVNTTMMVGYALCQLWLTLCFFAPQLFPENASVSVYEISLGVSALSLAPALMFVKTCEALMERPKVILWIAVCAGLGTFIIPFSSGDTVIAMVLQGLAGIMTGVASGWFFVMWYQAFCKNGDLVGFVLSVLFSSLFMYVLTAVAYIPDVSPWIMVAVASIMPIVSAVMLIRQPSNTSFVSEPFMPPKHTEQRKGLFLLCASIFVISFVDEFMRNYYLDGTDLRFYSDSLNLILLIVKILTSLVLVWIIAERSHQMSLVYRLSFLLTMVAVLFMPYSNSFADFFYGVTNFGAYLFKIMIMIIAFNFCHRYRTSPTLVFSLTRIAFSLDLLLGFGTIQLFRIFEPEITDLLGVVSVLLGLLIVAVYSFVFTDSGNIAIFVKDGEPRDSGASFEERCDRLVRVGHLSDRESDVLRLITKGRSATRISEELHVSLNTVNTHTSHIYQKLQVHSRQELLDLFEDTAPEEC